MQLEPKAWLVISEPRQTWHFARTKEDAERISDNLLKYAARCTSTTIEPLYLQAVRADLHDTLTEERDRLKEIVDGTGLATAAIAAERDQLAKANAELLEGLEFYLDGFRYHPKRSVTGINLSEWKPTERLLDDLGETARALLDKHKATSTEHSDDCTWNKTRLTLERHCSCGALKERESE